MWVVYLIESERGWGQRVDDVREFDNHETALAYVREFNSKNDLDYVPDWYMYATEPAWREDKVKQ